MGRSYSSLSSDSSSESWAAAAAFLAGFFFFLLLLFFPVFLDSGCSKIFRISSSVIFLSELTLPRSKAGAAASLVMPFLVMAVFESVLDLPRRSDFVLSCYLPMVVSRRATGALSLSPASSYCRKTLPRTHSTTPDLASRSSSSCLKLNGKVPNFF